jgi:hypothetical protein
MGALTVLVECGSLTGNQRFSMCLISKTGVHLEWNDDGSQGGLLR